MDTTNLQSEQQTPIHLAIAPDKLATLIRSGYLTASDFNCLDTDSKRGVWSLLRTVAASKLA